MQDPLGEPPQLRHRLDAELLCQGPAQLSEGGQGVGLAPDPIEPEHQLTPRPLPQRVLGDVSVEPVQGILRPPDREQRLCEVLDNRQAGLL